MYRYSGCTRPKVRAAHPEYTVPQLGKALGAQWGALSEKARKPYEKKAAKDKARYEEQMQAYRAQ